MHRNLRPGGYQPAASRLFTTPRAAHRKSKVRASGDGGGNNYVDRLTCTVCGFAGVNIATVPGENFPTVMVTAGTTYVWTSPDQAVSVIDKTVTPTPQSKVSCPFCGSTRFLDGSKGKGQ